MSAQQDVIEAVQATERRIQEQVEIVLQELITEQKIDLMSADRVRQAVPLKPEPRPEPEPESESESEEPESEPA